MDNDIIEVNDLASDMIIPIYVSSNGDWPGAVLAAAHLDRAEINVYENDYNFCVTVYSDDANVGSGRWWSEQVSARRRYLGR